MNFANWPLYIDTDDADPTKHKTLEDFKAKYGTTVNYSRSSTTTTSSFDDPAGAPGARHRMGPVRAHGLDGARLIRLGWTEQFDLSVAPNKVANMQDVHRGRRITDDHHAPGSRG
jgi:spermidine/putrescine transport system substrate-binding protein